MELELLLVLRHGAARIAALLGEQRQVEVRQPHVRLLCERLPNLLLGAIQFPCVQRHHAERVARRGHRRLDLRAPACSSCVAPARSCRDRSGSARSRSGPARSSDRAGGTAGIRPAHRRHGRGCDTRCAMLITASSSSGFSASARLKYSIASSCRPRRADMLPSVNHASMTFGSSLRTCVEHGHGGGELVLVAPEVAGAV